MQGVSSFSCQMHNTIHTVQSLEQQYSTIVYYTFSQAHNDTFHEAHRSLLRTTTVFNPRMDSTMDSDHMNILNPTMASSIPENNLFHLRGM